MKSIAYVSSLLFAIMCFTSTRSVLDSNDTFLKVTLTANLEDSGEAVFKIDIANTKNDTVLVLTQPFLIEGEMDTSRKLHPWPGQFYTVNTLYFEQEGTKFSFSGDADIRPVFSSFPKLIVINPLETKTLNLSLDNNLRDIFKGGRFNIWCTIVYGIKKDFESRIDQESPLWKEYTSALISNGHYNIKIQDDLEILDESQGNMQITKIIWKGMPLRISSSTITVNHH